MAKEEKGRGNKTLCHAQGRDKMKMRGMMHGCNTLSSSKAGVGNLLDTADRCNYKNVLRPFTNQRSLNE